MFAQVQIPGESGEVLTVPGSAVLRTGTRNLVFVSEQPGRFRPVAVELGAERDGDVAILAGLEEGQKVAVSGQFLIDSEASLQGLTAGAAQEHPTAAAGQPDGKAVHGEHSAATTTPPPSAPLHEASGTLTAIEGDSVTLSHGPVPTLQWGAMTMGFTLARAELAKGLKVGDAVRFRFRQSHDGFVVEQIEKSGDGK
jgi:Cu(I)/Ag(I) efflux system membrane fusion protein